MTNNEVKHDRYDAPQKMRDDDLGVKRIWSGNIYETLTEQDHSCRQLNLSNAFRFCIFENLHSFPCDFTKNVCFPIFHFCLFYANSFFSANVAKVQKGNLQSLNSSNFEISQLILTCKIIYEHLHENLKSMMK